MNKSCGNALIAFVQLVMTTIVWSAPMREFPVYFVQTADSDGQNAAAIDLNSIYNYLNAANKVWKTKNIKFTFADKDLYPEVIKNTFLNRDFAISPEAKLNDKDVSPTIIDKPYSMARNELAQKHAGKIVVFVGRGSHLFWNARVGKWIDIPRKGWGWSNHLDSFIAFPNHEGIGGGNFFAHEVGHYLHLGHTFGILPKNKNEFIDTVKKGVKEWNWQKASIPFYFDGDQGWVNDTPSDPGPDLFKDIAGDACSLNTKSITIDVPYDDGETKTYTFTPDRTNIMSYFKDCTGWDNTVSIQQGEVVEQALNFGNRQHLLNAQNKWKYLTPTAIASPDGETINLFVRGVSSGIFQKIIKSDGSVTPSDPAAPWTALGGDANSSVAIGNIEDKKGFYLTYINAAGKLKFKVRHDGYWGPSGKSWENNIDEIFVGKPAMAPHGNFVIDVVAVNKEGKVIFRRGNNVSLNLKRIDLGGDPEGNPVAIYDELLKGTRIFVRFKDKSIWQKIVLDNNTIIPSGADWENIGGLTNGDPQVVSWARGRFDLVVRGADNAIWHKAMAFGNWYPGQLTWSSIGGLAQGNPSILSYKEGHLDIIVRGADGGIWHKRWSETSWWPAGANWSNLGGFSVDDPTFVSRGFRSLDIFTRGLDGGVYQKSFVGNQWIPAGLDWKDLGRNH